MIKEVRPQIILDVVVDPVSRLKEAADFLDAKEIVESVSEQRGAHEVTLKPEMVDYMDLAGELIQGGFRIKKFAEKETNLESAFMALTRGSGAKI